MGIAALLVAAGFFVWRRVKRSQSVGLQKPEGTVEMTDNPLHATSDRQQIAGAHPGDAYQALQGPFAKYEALPGAVTNAEYASSSDAYQGLQGPFTKYAALSGAVTNSEYAKPSNAYEEMDKPFSAPPVPVRQQAPSAEVRTLILRK